MFEKATRMKLRFPYKGLITVEDLWDLPVTALDGIYKVLKAEERKQNEDTLLGSQPAKDSTNSLQIDIIKHIVSVKQQEAYAIAQKKDRDEQKRKIMSILSDKQEDALKNKSPEELMAMLDKLD